MQCVIIWYKEDKLSKVCLPIIALDSIENNSLLNPNFDRFDIPDSLKR